VTDHRLCENDKNILQGIKANDIIAAVCYKGKMYICVNNEVLTYTIIDTSAYFKSDRKVTFMLSFNRENSGEENTNKETCISKIGVMVLSVEKGDRPQDRQHGGIGAVSSPSMFTYNPNVISSCNIVEPKIKATGTRIYQFENIDSVADTVFYIGVALFDKKGKDYIYNQSIVMKIPSGSIYRITEDEDGNDNEAESVYKYDCGTHFNNWKNLYVEVASGVVSFIVDYDVKYNALCAVSNVGATIMVYVKMTNNNKIRYLGYYDSVPDVEINE
jgi:hypothetical protein